MDEAAISKILDRVAPKRRGDTEQGVYRAALHVRLKAGYPVAEAIMLAKQDVETH